MDSISYFFRRLLFRSLFDQPPRAPFVRAHHNLITKKTVPACFCLSVLVFRCTGAAMITAPNEIHKFRTRVEEKKAFRFLLRFEHKFNNLIQLKVEMRSYFNVCIVTSVCPFVCVCLCNSSDDKSIYSCHMIIQANSRTRVGASLKTQIS